MNKTITELPAIKLIGITARTSNTQEMNLETSKIGAIMQKFFVGGYAGTNLGAKKSRYSICCLYKL